MSSSKVVPGGTVGERIYALWMGFPPPPGRKSRRPHGSLDDFAAALGTSRQRVAAWIRGESEPEDWNRQRLAEASGGRYTADDFRQPRAPSELEAINRKLDQIVELLAPLRPAAPAATGTASAGAELLHTIAELQGVFQHGNAVIAQLLAAATELPAEREDPPAADAGAARERVGLARGRRPTRKDPR